MPQRGQCCAPERPASKHRRDGCGSSSSTSSSSERPRRSPRSQTGCARLSADSRGENPPVVELLRIVEPKALERRPARIGHGAIAVARRRVAIDPALRADSGAVGPAQRVLRAGRARRTRARPGRDRSGRRRSRRLPRGVGRTGTARRRLDSDTPSTSIRQRRHCPCHGVRTVPWTTIPSTLDVASEIDRDVAGDPFVVDSQLGRGSVASTRRVEPACRSRSTALIAGRWRFAIATTPFSGPGRRSPWSGRPRRRRRSGGGSRRCRSTASGGRRPRSCRACRAGSRSWRGADRGSPRFRA